MARQRDADADDESAVVRPRQQQASLPEGRLWDVQTVEVVEGGAGALRRTFERIFVDVDVFENDAADEAFEEPELLRDSTNYFALGK